jgi:hypothetical protein
MKTFFYLFILILIPYKIYSQQNCNSAIILCENSTFAGNSNGFGTQELNASNRGCILSNERQSSWYILNVYSGGTLTFNIVPINPLDDYDFAVWNYSGICPITSQPIRCSYAAGGGATGLNNSATDVSETSLGDRFVRRLNVSDGETYLLLINNFSTSNTPFNFNFGGTAQLGCFLLDLEYTLNGFANGHRNLLSLYHNDIESVDIEYSYDCVIWNKVITSNSQDFVIEHTPQNLNTYYRARSSKKISDVICVENRMYSNKKVVKTFDILGREIDKNQSGFKIYKMSDETFIYTY